MMFHSYIPEGICFAAFVGFVARGYTMQFFICGGVLNMMYYYLLLLCTLLFRYSIYVFTYLCFLLCFG
jgi:hypothetical protein